MGAERWAQSCLLGAPSLREAKHLFLPLSENRANGPELNSSKHTALSESARWRRQGGSGVLQGRRRSGLSWQGAACKRRLGLVLGAMGWHRKACGRRVAPVNHLACI